jgi:hypothetical protein
MSLYQWTAKAEAAAWRRAHEGQRAGEFSPPSTAWADLRGVEVSEPTPQVAEPEPVESAESLDSAPAPLRLEGLEGLAEREAGGASTPEQVDHPAHYHAESGREVIEIIEAWRLNFSRGNALKYLARAGHKDPAREVQDLEKARWYIEREIKRLKTESAR